MEIFNAVQHNAIVKSLCVPVLSRLVLTIAIMQVSLQHVYVLLSPHLRYSSQQRPLRKALLQHTEPEFEDLISRDISSANTAAANYYQLDSFPNADPTADQTFTQAIDTITILDIYPNLRDQTMKLSIHTAIATILTKTTGRQLSLQSRTCTPCIQMAIATTAPLRMSSMQQDSLPPPASNV